MTYDKRIVALGAALLMMGASLAEAQCPASDPGCTEYTGAGKKGSFFHISIPSATPWNGDVMLINHGFELNAGTIKGHNTCRLAGTACTADIDCLLVDDVCNKVDFFVWTKDCSRRASHSRKARSSVISSVEEIELKSRTSANAAISSGL